MTASARQKSAKEKEFTAECLNLTTKKDETHSVWARNRVEAEQKFYACFGITHSLYQLSQK